MQALYKPIICIIQIVGEIDPVWFISEYEMDYSYTVDELQDPVTLINGELPDYAALYGILNYLYGLGLRLKSVQVLSTNWEQ